MTESVGRHLLRLIKISWSVYKRLHHGASLGEKSTGSALANLPTGSGKLQMEKLIKKSIAREAFSVKMNENEINTLQKLKVNVEKRWKHSVEHSAFHLSTFYLSGWGNQNASKVDECEMDGKTRRKILFNNFNLHRERSLHTQNSGISLRFRLGLMCCCAISPLAGWMELSVDGNFSSSSPPSLPSSSLSRVFVFAQLTSERDGGEGFFHVVNWHENKRGENEMS